MHVHSISSTPVSRAIFGLFAASGLILGGLASVVATAPSAAATGPQLGSESVGQGSSSAILAVPHIAYSCHGSPVTLFDNWNVGAVENGGTSPTFSTNGKSYCLVSVFDYHWNNGTGKAPGTIGLLSSTGVSLGPWKAVGSPGSGVQNDGWTVKPGTTSKPVVINGTYRCVDSDPASWSQNSQSSGKGFCQVVVTAATTTTSGATPADIVKKAQNLFAAARSVHLNGTLYSGGALKIDLVAFGNGDLAGFMTGPLGNTLHLIIVNGKTYLESNASFWEKWFKVPPVKADKLASTWILSSTSSGSSSGLSIKSAFEFSSTAKLSSAGKSIIAGQSVVGVRDATGKTLWVASTGKGYPVALTTVSSGKNYTVTFSHWNADNLPTPPKKVVPISSITK